MAESKNKGSGLYAQRHILDGDRVIVRGTELPADFDAEKLATLKAGGHVGDKAPAAAAAPEKKA